MELAAAAAEAERRLRPYVRETPLARSSALSAGEPGEVWLKLENYQHTGSFKLRGALNKLLTLDLGQLSHGVVAASSGNHGAAVAYACRLLGVPATIFVPEHASPVKLAAIERLGAEVRRYGDDSLLAEQYGREYAQQHRLTYISPYNDWDVVAGQGSIGVEILRQAERLDAVFVAVGGGGLISGVAGALKAHWPDVTVVGCLPQKSPVMAESVRAGRLLDLPSLPTLSDGTAGGIEAGAITFDLCRTLVDEYVLVGEDEIAAAIRLCIEGEHMLIEGAAGVAVAAFQKVCERFRDQCVAIVLCGANIGVETLRSIL
jgi:threonine dehydratase